MEIRCRNVNDGLAKGLKYLLEEGQLERSRNGTVIAAPEPVIITYERPWERVIFSPLRNANPFFHLFESLWMLAGRNDVKFPVRYNKRFNEYSDDGVSINGAYGYRWRNHFQRDQIDDAIVMLKNDPQTRRVVVGMWDPECDLGSKSRDIPCNTHIYFDTRDGNVNMTVCNRSNDVLWGCFGANAVHMSILQEYIAIQIGKDMGRYTQFTNNLHLYTDILALDASEALIQELESYHTPYQVEKVNLVPLKSTSVQEWYEDLQFFLEEPSRSHIYHDPFFGDVAGRMAIAWEYRHEKFGREIAATIVDDAWRTACCEWMDRATEKRKK